MKKNQIFFLIAAFASFVLSVSLWFLGEPEIAKEQGIFVGLWVPSILALGGYFNGWFWTLCLRCCSHAHCRNGRDYIPGFYGLHQVREAAQRRSRIKTWCWSESRHEWERISSRLTQSIRNVLVWELCLFQKDVKAFIESMYEQSMHKKIKWITIN